MNVRLLRLLSALQDAQNAVAAVIGTEDDNWAIRSADQHIRVAFNDLVPFFNAAGREARAEEAGERMTLREHLQAAVDAIVTGRSGEAEPHIEAARALRRRGD